MKWTHCRTCEKRINHLLDQMSNQRQMISCNQNELSYTAAQQYFPVSYINFNPTWFKDWPGTSGLTTIAKTHGPERPQKTSYGLETDLE